MSNDWPPYDEFMDGPPGIAEPIPSKPPPQTYTPTYAWSANERADGTRVPPAWVATSNNNHASEWYTSTGLWEYCKRALLMFALVFILFCMTAFIIGMIAGIAGAM